MLPVHGLRKNLSCGDGAKQDAAGSKRREGCRRRDPRAGQQLGVACGGLLWIERAHKAAHFDCPLDDVAYVWLALILIGVE